MTSVLSPSLSFGSVPPVLLLVEAEEDSFPSSSPSSSSSSDPEAKYPALYPLLWGLPRCLLSVGNRPLLSYQLESLIQGGAADIHVLAPAEYQPALERCLCEFAARFNLLYINCDGAISDGAISDGNNRKSFNGRIRSHFSDGRKSADLLRHWYLNQSYFQPFSSSNNNSNNRNEGNSSSHDVVLIFADHICQVPIGRFINFHRSTASNLTILLCNAESRRSAVKEMDMARSDSTPGPDSEDLSVSLVCYNSDHRIVLKSRFKALEKASMAAVGESSYLLQKSLLEAVGDQATFRGDLADIGLYAISDWIFEFMMHHKEMTDFREQVAPHIIHSQYLKEEGSNLKLLTDFSDGANNYLERARDGRSGLEKVLVSRTTPGSGPEASLATHVQRDLRNMLQQLDAASSTSCDLAKSPHSTLSKQSEDLIRCFAFIVDPAERSANAAPKQMQFSFLDPNPEPIIFTLSNLNSLFYLNKEVPLVINAWQDASLKPLEFMPWGRTWVPNMGNRLKAPPGLIEGAIVEVNYEGQGVWLLGRLLGIETGSTPGSPKTFHVVLDTGKETHFACEAWLRPANWNQLIMDTERQCILPVSMSIPKKDNCHSCSIGYGVTVCGWSNSDSEDKATFIGNSIIMDNVTIGESCSIEKCVIGPGAKIGRGCTLERCIIGPGTEIGAECSMTNCRLRGKFEEKLEPLEDRVIVHDV